MTIQPITSLLDNDFYKFTMQNAVVKLFPYSKAKYQFINRGEHQFPEGFGQALRQAVDSLSNLKLTAAEKEYLKKSCSYLPPTYLDFLSGFRFDPTEVDIQQVGNDLSVSIEGLWYRTILWEVPILSLISELYYDLTDHSRLSNEEVMKIAQEKIEHYREIGVKVAEFGTRRRFSFAVHELVMGTLKTHGGDSFIGTSNVALAMKYGVKPIGTHAHEWFMYHAAYYGFKMANRTALENWVEVYRGDLGIALSDTYTNSIFFESFDKKFSKLFDGVRHDSGDPIEFAQQTITHYQSLGIDPVSKFIVFSDGLDPDKVDRIAEFCKGKIGMSFGIGTNFTNDVGVVPMNIVLKMTATQPEGGGWVEVVKLSDEKGKHSGNKDMIDLAKKVLEIKS